jgi:hypothetical protein
VVSTIQRWQRRYRYRRFAGRSTEDVFVEIHDTNAWRNVESISGPGSELAQTEVIRRILPRLIEELGIASVLDAPYIVAAMIERNQKLFGNERRSFAHLDITTGEIPTVDLILCRDCLIHLSFDQIHAALRNLQASGSTYLLTTTYPNRRNIDIPTGGFRQLNLRKPPFGLPDPLSLIAERPDVTDPGAMFFGRSLGLWRLGDLKLR